MTSPDVAARLEDILEAIAVIGVYVAGPTRGHCGGTYFTH